LLKEKLSLFGWISSVQCLLGAAILALNGPQEQSVDTIEGFKHLFVTPWFLAYGGVVIATAIFLALWVAPRYGKKSMLPWIGICSLIGGLSVSCTQGLGACIVTTIRGENQFKNWFIYFLLAFVVCTLLTEIYYLNVALAMFNTAMVTPTYYVTFTFCTLVTSVILYQGLKASAGQIITVVLAFVVICTGIFILQMSKVDPRSLPKVDEPTALMLEVARRETDPFAVREVELERGGTMRSRRSRRARTTSSQGPAIPPGRLQADQSTDHLDAAVEGPAELPDEDADVDSELDELETKRIIAKTEEPGIDALRGTLGLIGTIIRARRRASALSARSRSRSNVGSSSLASQDAVLSVSTQGSNGRFNRLGSRGRGPSRAHGSTIHPYEDAIREDALEKGDNEKGMVEGTDVVSNPRSPASLRGPSSEIAGLPSTGSNSAVQTPVMTSSFFTSPMPTPSEGRHGSTVHFASEHRDQMSVPNVQSSIAGDSRQPSAPTQLGDLGRSRTLPSSFTAEERQRAEDVVEGL